MRNSVWGGEVWVGTREVAVVVTVLLYYSTSEWERTVFSEGGKKRASFHIYICRDICYLFLLEPSNILKRTEWLHACSLAFPAVLLESGEIEQDILAWLFKHCLLLGPNFPDPFMLATGQMEIQNYGKRCSAGGLALYILFHHELPPGRIHWQGVPRGHGFGPDKLEKLWGNPCGSIVRVCFKDRPPPEMPSFLVGFQLLPPPELEDSSCTSATGLRAGVAPAAKTVRCFENRMLWLCIIKKRNGKRNSLERKKANGLSRIPSPTRA